MKQHYLRHLINEGAQGNTLIGIDYKREIISEVRLELKVKLTIDGLFDSGTYYHYQEDKDHNIIPGTGKPVIKITDEYTYDPTQLADPNIPRSHVDINKRVKMWRYYFIDGTLDESNDLGTYKIKPKRYTTRIQRLEVGNKRRNNIYVDLSSKLGALLIIFGITDGVDGANNILREFANNYTTEFYSYQTIADPRIYTSINANTTTTWLDIYVPNDTDMTNMIAANIKTPTEIAMLKGALSLYGLNDAKGLKVKDYLIKKLKGEVN